jgi:hypothetical protein
VSELSSNKPTRVFYIDNIRLFLTILVILHHVAIVYGGSGYFPVLDTPTDGISPIFLAIFTAINQSFFMALFVMLSAYFAPRSYDKKGAGKFLADRLIRLGVPMLFYTTVFSTIIKFLIVNFVDGQTVSILKIITNKIAQPRWDIGPLWFLELLLIFTVVYLLVRFVAKKAFTPYKDTFPGNFAIIISIFIMSVGTFVVRIWYPMGKILHVFQLAHNFHYAFCFWLGILAYRGKWFEHISRQQARVWKITALFCIFILPVMFAIAGDNIEAILGGFTLLSFLVSTWESIACLSIIISILSIFQNRYKNQGRLAKWMSPNFFIAFIIHYPIIVAVTIPLLSVAIPTYVKFFIVGVISIFLCFSIGNLIRKIPGTKKVLG